MDARHPNHHPRDRSSRPGGVRGRPYLAGPHRRGEAADARRVPEPPGGQHPRLALLDQLFEVGYGEVLLPDRITGVFGYHEAIAWFIDAQPVDGQVHAGAILRRPSRTGGVEIIQVFLTERYTACCDDSGRPAGRYLIVDGIDDQLSEAFGNSDLLILE